MEHKIEIPETNYHRLINRLCISLYMILTLLILFYWNKLSDTVPTHYDAEGTPDAYGSKMFVFFCPIVSFFLYLFMKFIEQHPVLWNIPVSTTSKNSDHIYLMTKNMLVTIRFILVINFFHISVQIIRERSLGEWFVPVTLAVLFSVTLLYIIRIYKVSKTP